MALSQDELKKFWDIANTLRKSLDAAEYKHIVLGLVFLKHVSDSFENRRAGLERDFSDPTSDSYKPNPQAKRLHYLKKSGGAIELLQVSIHDDFGV